MKKVMLALIVSLTGVSAGATEWKLSRENEHLKIYTGNTENSGLKSVKVECTVTASVSQVLAAFFDVEGQQKWVYGDKTSKKLSQINDSEYVYYSEVSVPWPFSNRDFVAHVKASQPSHDMVIIDSYGLPDYIPEKAGIVRVKSSSSHLVLSSLGNNTTKIDYIIQFDPSGDIPSWVTNIFVTKGPFESFEKLPERLRQPDYQTASFSFIK